MNDDFSNTESFYTEPERKNETPESPAAQPAHPEKAAHTPAKPSARRKAAEVVSSVFSPLLLPTYSAILVLWTTPLHNVRELTRLTTALMILVFTCFVPLAALLAAVRLGKVSDTKVRDRRQRFFLYPVAVIAYGFTAIYLHKVHAPGWFSGFFLGATLATITDMIVNFRWKISAHATCCGGMLGLCFFIAATELNDFFFLPWISGAVLITGAVCTSRLVLRAHTLSQLCAGLATGITAVAVMMSVCYF